MTGENYEELELYELNNISKLYGGDVIEHEAQLPDDGSWFRATSPDSKLVYDIADRELDEYEYLVYELILLGDATPKFELELSKRESSGLKSWIFKDRETGFRVLYGVIGRCMSRIAVKLSPDSHTELKPFGGRGHVLTSPKNGILESDRLEIGFHFFPLDDAVWWQSPVRLTREKPAEMTEPEILDDYLIDRFGQNNVSDWDGKTASEAELRERLNEQRWNKRWRRPDSLSKWGGRSDTRFEATGYFRTHHDGERWWLVDPDGHPFWSLGVNCVCDTIRTDYTGLENVLEESPEKLQLDERLLEKTDDYARINYLGRNFYRVFGDEWKERWRSITETKLRELNVNTIGAWSADSLKDASGTPYTEVISPTFDEVDEMDGLPDVFDPQFEAEVRAATAHLKKRAGDPYFIGYFVDNEPFYLFKDQSVVEQMLRVDGLPYSREKLREFLAEKQEMSHHTADDEIARLEAEIRKGGIERLSDETVSLLETFSAILVERFYQTISDIYREAAPEHLNLGVRSPVLPPDWATDAMRCFDVFSLNWYGKTPDTEVINEISRKIGVPVMITEFSFGSLDVGHFSSGVAHVANQDERARAFRTYVDNAAASSNCVGAHYFQYYDQSPLGRSDGENFHIGIFDVCNRPYEELFEEVQRAGTRMYDVATGERLPYTDDQISDVRHW